MVAEAEERHARAQWAGATGWTDADETRLEANYALLQWGAAKGLVWDKWETEKGDAFGSRFEAFLTNPDEEPDRTKWETEVAIRLAS